MDLGSSISSITPLIFFHLCISATNAQSRLQLLLTNDPVIHEIEIVALTHEEISHHRDKVLVIWLFLEFKFPTIVQKLAEFFRVSSSKVFDARYSLFNLDLLVLFFFGLGWQPLPRKCSPDKVHKHYSNLLQIIPSCLLYAEVCVQTGIASSPSETLIVFKWDMPACFWILIPLCQAEIDYENDMLVLARTDQEVIRLYVSM